MAQKPSRTWPGYSMLHTWDSDATTALSLLLQIDENNMSDLYFKSVLHYLQGSIYVQKEMYDDALSHYKKELEFVENSGVSEKSIIALNHIALAYNNVGQTDSAFITLRKALDYCNKTNTKATCGLYNSLARYYEQYYPDSLEQIEQFYLKACQTDGNSFTPHANLANYYYRSGKNLKGDSLTQLIQKEGRDDLNAMSMIFKYLCDYYEKNEMADSVLKYNKLHELYYDSVHRLSQTENIVRLQEQSKSKQVIRKKNSTIIAVVLLSLTLVVSMTAISYYHRRQNRVMSKTKDKEIEWQRAEIQSRISDSQQKEQESEMLKMEILQLQKEYQAKREEYV